MDIENLSKEIIHMDEENIEYYLEEAVDILNEEKAFIEKDKPVITFIGDLHGDFNTAKAIIERFLGESLLVFLGDYIDRESMKWGSIYTITYLLVIKSLYPKDIVLLKGNHECNDILPFYPHEFEREIIERFKSSRLNEKFIEVFHSLPLIFKGKNVIATHGGILKNVTLDSLRELDKNDVDVLSSIVWSDPIISPIHRGIGDRFNKETLNLFLRNTKSSVFIRGHTPYLLGISIYDDRCLTIFSSRRYIDMGNKGIIVAQAYKEINSASDMVIQDFSSGIWMPYEIKKL